MMIETARRAALYRPTETVTGCSLVDRKSLNPSLVLTAHDRPMKHDRLG